MALPWFGQGKATSVDDLIARKRYARAIELIRAAIRKRRNDNRLRLRLADVLVLNGQKREAAALLNAVADDVALAGNAAQAIALLKRVEALEPGRPDVEEKLAYYIRHRSRPASGRWAAPAPAADELELRNGPDDEPAELEVVTPPPHLEPAGAEATAATGPDAPPGAPPPEPDEAGTASSPRPATSAPASQPGRPPPKRVKLQPPEASPEQALREELEGLLEEVLSPVEDGAPPEPAASAATAAATPLFRDFAQEELVEVIRGLALERLEPGEIVVTQGEPGDSLYVIASGSVRAWVRGASGRSLQVRTLGEGDFFGEISLLTGEPRSATITTAARCELLVLDRAAVDRIASRHPRVLEVLEAFHAQRAGNTLEAMIRELGAG